MRGKADATPGPTGTVSRGKGAERESAGWQGPPPPHPATGERRADGARRRSGAERRPGDGGSRGLPGCTGPRNHQQRPQAASAPGRHEPGRAGSRERRGRPQRSAARKRKQEAGREIAEALRRPPTSSARPPRPGHSGARSGRGRCPTARLRRSRVNVSGRVSALAVDPANPAHVLCGAANGGVWESRDRGARGRRAPTTRPRSPSARWPSTRPLRDRLLRHGRRELVVVARRRRPALRPTAGPPGRPCARPRSSARASTTSSSTRRTAATCSPARPAGSTSRPTAASTWTQRAHARTLVALDGAGGRRGGRDPRRLRRRPLPLHERRHDLDRRGAAGRARRRSTGSPSRSRRSNPAVAYAWGASGGDGRICGGAPAAPGRRSRRRRASAPARPGTTGSSPSRRTATRRSTAARSRSHRGDLSGTTWTWRNLTNKGAPGQTRSTRTSTPSPSSRAARTRSTSATTAASTAAPTAASPGSTATTGW